MLILQSSKSRFRHNRLKHQRFQTNKSCQSFNQVNQGSDMRFKRQQFRQINHVNLQSSKSRFRHEVQTSAVKTNKSCQSFNPVNQVQTSFLGTTEVTRRSCKKRK